MSEISFSLPDELVDDLVDRLAERLNGSAKASNGSVPVLTEQADRLALTQTEAAKRIGVSVDHLQRHILPELRVVRTGRLRLIPVSELAAWIERHASRALEADRRSRS